MEKEVLRIIQKYFDFNIDLDSDIVLLGANSLKMMMIKWEIERKFGVEITYEDFIEIKTVNDFIKTLRKYREI